MVETKRGRPKKYFTPQQRLAAKKSYNSYLRGMNFRLVIPNLTDYVTSSDLIKLKEDTLSLLLRYQTHLQYYKIAAQTHSTTGVPHLDILLLYKKTVKKTLNRFDYLVKHGNLSRYKKINGAILAYGDKEDVNPLSNMPNQLSLVLKAKLLQSDPYSVLYDQMMKNPFHFDSHVWLNYHKLSRSIAHTNWSKAISLLKYQQQAECNRLLYDKPGFKFIDRSLIQQKLSPSQLHTFDSWVGFQIIVDHLNQVPLYGCRRPFKTKNLLLVGPSHIGKTSLISQPGHHRCIPTVQDVASTYHLGMKHWFPRYKSGVYKTILWDEFKLTSYAYDTLLKFLQGSPVDLPYHGGSTRKDDNPLVIMTSNLPLQRHIRHKFHSEQDRQRASQNLSYRITELEIPPGLDVFLLRKLLVLRDGS